MTPIAVPRRLADKRIVVTGASRGLGRAFCVAFAAAGARVAFNYAKDEVGARVTAAAIEAAGGEALAIRASVVEEADMSAMARQVERAWGHVDVLVNNAGLSEPFPLPLIGVDDWDRVMGVNAKGHFLATRAFIRGMIRRKAGAILNIGSLAGIRLIESPVHYAASKAAIKGFTQALAKEVARYDIRVNCLAPGLLEDGVGRSLPEHRLDDYVRHVPLGRVGTFDEVARCAAFMVSDANSYMTGETVLMDGGI